MSMPRTTRLLVGLLSAALLGLVPIGLASPARAADPTTIEATISKVRAVYGTTFRIFGSTSCASGIEADGEIELFRRKAGSDRWVSLGTQPAGSFEFTGLVAIQNATYGLSYPGAGTCASAAVAGDQKVHRTMLARANDRLVFSGTVKPAWKRKPVIIQVKKGSRWVTYAKVKTNSRSKWSKKVYARRGSTTRFRAFVKGTVQFQKSYTGVLRTWYARSTPRVSAR